MLSQQLNCLTPAQRSRAAQEMTAHLISHPLFVNSQSIAAFYAHHGEIDPSHLLEEALKLNKQCYLPVINKYSGNELVFCRINHQTRYLANCYGILEPELHANSQCLPALQLDLVLVPLLGIDKQGHRLGRGGGFYDRTFQFKNNTLKPFLMGLAYTLQYLEEIPVDPYDIPLDGLATEQGVILCKQTN